MGLLALIFAVAGAAMNVLQPVIASSLIGGSSDGVSSMYDAFMVIFNNVKANGWTYDTQTTYALVIFGVLCLITVWAVIQGLCALFKIGHPGSNLFICALVYGLIAGGLYYLAVTPEIPAQVSEFLNKPFVADYIMPYIKDVPYITPAIWAGCYLLASLCAAGVKKAKPVENQNTYTAPSAPRSNVNLNVNTNATPVNNIAYPVEMVKGQKFDFAKNNAGLSNLVIGLGWNANSNFDISASAFLLGSNEKVLNDIDFVFYNNPEHESGAVKITGANGFDSEQLNINLARIPADVSKIAFAVSIHDAEAKGQDFSQVSNLFIRVVDGTTSKELLRYYLTENFLGCTAMVASELVRNARGWTFSAGGGGFNGGLMALCKQYGVNV